MIGKATEEVVFLRAASTVEAGRRKAAAPAPLGALRMLAAPTGPAAVADVGRLTVHAGYDLYLRGPAPFPVREGDLAVVRGETLTVTQAPSEWRRGSTVVGVVVHAERGRDQ